MDDILSFHATETTVDDPEFVKVYEDHDLPLTSQQLTTQDVVFVLGVEVCDCGTRLRYPTKEIHTAVTWPLTTPVTYRQALGFLGSLLQEADLLPYHILPCKNLLTGLVSKCRSKFDHGWDQAIPADVLNLLSQWQELLKSSTLTTIPRRVDLLTPLDIYADASKTMLAYTIEQSGDPVFRGQLPLTKSQK
ncbi:hypothetical protein Pmar_PMAR017798, partial [Perkinsus marinus ATCC 50983]